MLLCSYLFRKLPSMLRLMKWIHKISVKTRVLAYQLSNIFRSDTPNPHCLGEGTPQTPSPLLLINHSRSRHWPLAVHISGYATGSNPFTTMSYTVSSLAPVSPASVSASSTDDSSTSSRGSWCAVDGTCGLNVSIVVDARCCLVEDCWFIHVVAGRAEARWTIPAGSTFGSSVDGKWCLNIWTFVLVILLILQLDIWKFKLTRGQAESSGY